MGRVKGSKEGAGRERRKRRILFSPSSLSFFHPRTYPKGAISTLPNLPLS